MSRKKKDDVKNSQETIQQLANEFYMNRSKDAYQKLYLRVYWGLKSYLSQKFFNNDMETAEDIVSVVMEKVWTKIDMYDPMKANFSTWLYRIAINDALLYLKGRQKLDKKIVDNDISDLYSNTIIEGGDDSFAVQSEIKLDDKKTYGEVIDDMVDISIKCINKLPDNFKLALTKKIINKKTIDEIAYEKQIKKTTLVNWLYQGRMALKEKIKSEYKDAYENWQMGEENYLAL